MEKVQWILKKLHKDLEGREMAQKFGALGDL